ncbi:MAG TPA: type II toxin-antitoxin system PemK/MazF family toxin [Terriglobales bacterium]|nr:type II toxin-antitoxin system PemK/MazF family toxin [Terriglobales bacterium]
MVSRDEVWLIALDPALGAEMRKTRPCLVVSPNEMNANLDTVLVAPLTSRLRNYPTRAPISFGGKRGQVALDQLRAVDRARLVKRLGRASPTAALAVAGILTAMFARA